MSPRSRLFLSYVLIIVVCLGISAVSVSVLLQTYRDQVVMTRLDDMTRPIFVQIRSLLRRETTLAVAWTAVEDQAQGNNVYVIFVDDKGGAVRQASPSPSDTPLSAADGFPHSISQPAHGTFTTTSGQQFVYSAYPLGRLPSLQSNRPVTLVLSQPRGSIAPILAGVINPFIWAGLIALAISLVLAFFLARSVYKPVQRLSRAAEAISHGRYDEPVPLTGPEEVRGLAASFNDMAGKVKDSQQQLRHFVADVSHQLKSPLTSIQGFAQAMLDGTASDEATRQKAAGIIADESKRMIRQVNELLELSRMQSGQVKMAREQVDLKDLLLHCRDIFALRIEEKKITVKDQMGAAPAIPGDTDRLEDVFCNLLDNAIKNSPQGGELRLALNSADGKFVDVSIADSGPGIPPEQVPHVFDRFQQSSGLRTGFGLGLAIAREIVLAHGGKIEVTSNPGEGARFTVTLPVAAAGD